MPELRYYYNVKGVTGGIVYKSNSLKMRDREFPLKKTSQEYRILCVGDSTTFGAGERLQDTWPKQLERGLKGIDKSIFAINAGGAGGHPHLALKSYRQQHKEIDIDMYILGFCMNDVVIKSNQSDQERYMQQVGCSGWERFKLYTRGFRYSLSKSYIVGFLQYIFKKFDPAANNAKYIMLDRAYRFTAFGIGSESNQAWNDTFETLETLNGLLKRRNIKFVIVPIPYRFMVSNDPRDNIWKFDLKSFKIDPVDRLRNFCKEHNILFVESLAALESMRNKMLQGQITYNPLYQEITLDFCHPNAYGYAIIADAIYNTTAPLVKSSIRQE